MERLLQEGNNALRILLCKYCPVVIGLTARLADKMLPLLSSNTETYLHTQTPVLTDILQPLFPLMV